MVAPVAHELLAVEEEGELLLALACALNLHAQRIWAVLLVLGADERRLVPCGLAVLPVVVPDVEAFVEEYDLLVFAELRAALGVCAQRRGEDD